MHIPWIVFSYMSSYYSCIFIDSEGESSSADGSDGGQSPKT